MIETLSIIQIVAICFLIWFVKTHVSERIKKQAQEYGKLDAKVERLNDLVKVQATIHQAVEEVSQPLRVRLAFAEKIIAGKISAYDELLRKVFDLFRGLAKLTGEPNENIKHLNRQDEFYNFFNDNALYFSRESRRASEMLVAVMTDVMVISKDEGSIAKQVFDVQERSRIICDLIRVEAAIDLNNVEFKVFLPTRDQRDQWIEDSRNIEQLKNELATRSQFVVKTQDGEASP